MEEGTQNFATDLETDTSMPKSYKVSDFLKDRMEEVVMLTEAINESPFRGQAFQRLPKHMRRRQMSHYIKRLPRRLQRPYLLTLNNGMPTPTKRPSRKYRRRPVNLLIEYNRRQKENIWLETHIWHAKRFHMIKKWGYKLPEKPTNKSFRACYRAISEHCLITDISYYNCIQLEGPEIKLINNLKQCTSSDCGLTFGAQMYLNGAKEGSVTFFHPNSYPYKVIGNVSFMWKPTCSSDVNRTIWIWVHPLLHSEIMQCLINLFELKAENKVLELEIQESEKCTTNILPPSNSKLKIKKNKNKNVEESKLEPKNIPFIKTPKYKNDNDSVILTLLKDTLNRFQLTGPLSQAVVSQAFHLINTQSSFVIESLEKEDNSLKFDVVDIHSKKRKFDDCIEIKENIKKKKTDEKIQFKEKKLNWWENYFKEEKAYDTWECQKNFYEKMNKCSKPTDLPAGLIIPLIISDPRLSFPPKREKAVIREKGYYQITEDSYDPKLFQSPIWNHDIRDEVSLSKLTAFEINQAKRKNIVPGSGVQKTIPNEKQSRIPILLVQRPGVRNSQNGRLGLGSGYDIISPAGFGMPIWRALILHGARSGGLRETELLNLEMGNLAHFFQPDSLAGKIESETFERKMKSCYFRLPPAKRPNYIKLGVLSPFYSPWNLLVANWKERICNDTKLSECSNYRVMRDKKLLEELSKKLIKFFKGSIFNYDDMIKMVGKDSLVPVLIECSGKGRPKDLALICLPKEEDIRSSKPLEPNEPSHLDENKISRKLLKKERLKLIKSLGRKRKKEKARIREILANNSPNKLKCPELKNENKFSETLKEKYKTKMESLWIPEKSTYKNIIDFPSRKIIGFVVKGDYSFSKSTSKALGYVTILGLLELLKLVEKSYRKSKLKILVRNTNQTQYRFGMLNIILE